MDHSDSGEKTYAYHACEHGCCLNHNPEWEKVGEARQVPDPGITGAKTYWSRRHCGAAMTRVKTVQTYQCVKCGRSEHKVMNRLALCKCCGYHANAGTSGMGPGR